MYAWHAISRRCTESKSVSLNKTRLLQKCDDKCLSSNGERQMSSGRLFNTDIEMQAVQKQRRQRWRGRPVLTIVSLTRSGASDRIGWLDRSQHAAVTHHRQTAAMGAVPLTSLLILKFSVTLACQCQSSVFPSIFCFNLTCFTHNVYTCNQQTASLS